MIVTNLCLLSSIEAAKWHITSIIREENIMSESSVASYITFERQASYDKSILIFGVWNVPSMSNLFVKKYEHGFASISPSGGTNINDFAGFVAGAFHPESNFANAISSMYGEKPDSFKGIHFTFNEVSMTATRDNADAKRIVKEYTEKINCALKHQ